MGYTEHFIQRFNLRVGGGGGGLKNVVLRLTNNLPWRLIMYLSGTRENNKKTFLICKKYTLIHTIHEYEGTRSSPGFTKFWVFELRSFLNVEISVQFLCGSYSGPCLTGV